MCGISGFSGDRNASFLRDMTRRLAHRGPDDEGYYESDGMSLGVRRLAILDPKTGKQPVHNESRSVWCVFNGEIYNHAALRQELLSQGHMFYTHHSDTEVLVHLYEEYGENFAEKLNGMFAIALWDLARNKLILVRDRLGKKPLYYSIQKGRIAFASEIKALFSLPWISREIDSSTLSDYFSHKNISAPKTVFRDIRQILAGHFLVFQGEDAEEKAYWQLDFSRPLDISLEEAKSEVLRLLEDAVIQRMHCDVPLGAYLSGGLDSSLVVALMQRHDSRPIKTFSLGYEDKFDHKQTDLDFARKLSRRIGTEHHEYLMKVSELPEMLPKILQAFDEPFSGTISTYFLSQLIAKHVKVALSGDGADELFGSYLAHRLAVPVASFVQATPQERMGFEQYTLLKTLADPSIAVWRSRMDVFPEEEKRKLLLFKSGKNRYEFLSETLTARDPLNRVLEMDQKELLPNQVLAFVDRLSMAHSVEVRVPYLDYRLVEFVAKLPGEMKIHRGITKYLLRETAEGILPDDWIQRPKEGFVMPVYSWLRTSLEPFVRDVLSEERVSQSGLLSPSYICQLVDEFFRGRLIEAKIWNLVCFQVWWENYYDGAI